jgi:hypothetical protein
LASEKIKTWQATQPANPAPLTDAANWLSGDWDGDSIPLIVEAAAGNNPVHIQQSSGGLLGVVNLNNRFTVSFDTNLVDVGLTQSFQYFKPGAGWTDAVEGVDYEYVPLWDGKLEVINNGLPHQRWKTRGVSPKRAGEVLRLVVRQ